MKFRVRKWTTSQETLPSLDNVVGTIELLLARRTAVYMALWHCVSVKVSTYCNEGSLVVQTGWR